MVCTVPRLAELLPRGSSSDRISETLEMKKNSIVFKWVVNVHSKAEDSISIGFYKINGCNTLETLIFTLKKTIV